MPMRTAARVREAVADLSNPEIVIIGMAYKPETDDLRESPSIQVAELLRKDGYEIRQYDPLVRQHGYVSLADVARGADLLAVLVPHAEVLAGLHGEMSAIKSVMRTPRIITF